MLVVKEEIVWKKKLEEMAVEVETENFARAFSGVGPVPIVQMQTPLATIGE